MTGAREQTTPGGEEMARRLTVGVVGPGSRWERCRPAVEGPERVVDVRAIYDVSHRRATREAKRLHCEAARSLADLLEFPDLGAVAAGKPILCPAAVVASSFPSALCNTIRQRSLPTMAALATGIAPAVARLRVLLDKHLGPARSICCTKTTDRPETGASLLASTTLLSGIHLCRQLIGEAPETVHAAVPEGAGLVNLTFGFSGGRAARLTLTTGRRTPWRTVISAEKGSAEALLPRRLHWRDDGGRHALCLPRERAPVVLLRRFAQAVQAGGQPQPSLEDACRAYAWLEAARQSHATGRPVRFGCA